MKNSRITRITVTLLASLCLAAQPGSLFSQSQNPKGLTHEQIAAIHGRIVQAEEADAIPKLLARSSGDVVIRAPYLIVDEIQMDPENQLANWMRGCDLVAVGKIGTGNSYMTARRGFLNTDWNFAVEEVLKDNPQAPVASGTTIAVIAFGGRLRMGDRTVQAIQETYRELKNGSEYVLFLKFVPETGAYSVVWPMGFAFSGQRAVPLAKQLRRPDFEAMDRGALLAATKQASSR